MNEVEEVTILDRELTMFAKAYARMCAIYIEKHGIYNKQPVVTRVDGKPLLGK